MIINIIFGYRYFNTMGPVEIMNYIIIIIIIQRSLYYVSKITLKCLFSNNFKFFHFETHLFSFNIIIIVTM